MLIRKVMKEEEALTKLCSVLPARYCVTSECMAWISYADDVTGQILGGVCGLIQQNPSVVINPSLKIKEENKNG